MKSSHVKASVACYFRYTRQFPLVTFERSFKEYFIKPDILVVTKNRKLIEVEVKVSLSDLKNDIKKRGWVLRQKYPDLYMMPYQFYYAVPSPLKDKAIEIIKGWKDDGYMNGDAGLICVLDKDNLGYNDVFVAIKAPINKEALTLSLKNVVKMVKDQTGTLCSCAVKIAKLENGTYLDQYFKNGQGI